MALNSTTMGKRDSEYTDTGSLHQKSGEPQKTSAATSAPANQNGDQPGCGDSVILEQEAPERQTDARSWSGSPTPGQRRSEERPRKSFQIPRKKERKGLFQLLPPDSREFEDLVKLVSSFYLDASSRGTFAYCKARLIHNELLEKEFIEKRREMKQEGRTEQELTESYCFLYPDKSKLQWICEKGLSVGHSKITTVGNPTVGVYLAKFSDLLQINPFEVGAVGDIIIFKVMRGRVKHIHENMPNNAKEPATKFDCHLSKSANRVTSLLSYRAFERTQQYFFEFAFDEIKARPRHVCPYAVFSFQYKGKEVAATSLTTHRLNAMPSEGSRGRRCYSVWRGSLVNKGQELFPICLRSSSRPYLPFKLPEKLEVNQGMHLEQVKRKIPAVLFSWDTYSASREVMKYGMTCSLFEVVEGKGKVTSGSLAALINKLEKDRLVLVKCLFDRGFLFLLSSAQMVESKERRGRVEKSLQSIFLFHESRAVIKYSSRLPEPEPLKTEPQTTFQSLEQFIPALHYAFFTLRPNPGKDPSSGVERQATDYLSRIDSGRVRPFILPDYKYSVGDRPCTFPLPRPKGNMEALLRSYIHNPSNYTLPLNKAKDIIERIHHPTPVAEPVSVEYSPVSDWGGSDRSERTAPERLAQEKPPSDTSRRRPGLAHSNGAQLQHQSHTESQPDHPRLQLSQNEYDKDKMKQLLKLIQHHKRALVKDPGRDTGEDGGWVSNNLKRKFEGDERGSTNKHQRTDLLSNGEPSRGMPVEEIGEEGGQSENLTAVMESIGIYDTDLRACDNTNTTAVHETQRLLKILLATLNKAVAQGSISVQSNHGEQSTGPESGEPANPASDLGKQNELSSQTNYTEEDMDCSPTSPFSAGSPIDQAQTSPNTTFVTPANEEKLQSLLEPEPDTVMIESLVPKPPIEMEVKKAAPALTLPLAVEVPFMPTISLDTILNQEIHSLTSDIKNIMQSHHITYTLQLPPRLPLRNSWQHSCCFSDFVVDNVTPVSVAEHVTALCEQLERLIPVPPVPSKAASPAAIGTSDLTISSPLQTSRTEIQPPLMNTDSTQIIKQGTVKETKTKADAASAYIEDEAYSPSQIPPESSEKSQKSASASASACASTSASASGSVAGDSTGAGTGTGTGLLAGSLIGQLKPEVFSSLVEIFKDVTKNTVKFYIYSGDEGEESTVCKEIKEYLKSLGNSECSPAMFLENNNSLDKLLIIIQNEHIAAHVHKIPALVSLKKLPSVSFAGVDTLDDVKNHTYNELFVSGGFMVSDEFVLNPDLITQDRLQTLLTFLEEQSTPEQPWQWKVHCKSQKKLKEMGRLNANAMGLLNLLTAYQKKHLVEFLPYHECDAQSRQAPDLDCLIKLQAQHTQQRHLIFVTERPFEMFLQYSRNGIVIASIDDIMSGFHSLIGTINQNEVPTPASTANDECVEAEDMSLDSDDCEMHTITESKAQNLEDEKEKSPQPPPPNMDEFQPPLPDQEANPDITPPQPEYNALKTAISQFKATNQIGIGSSDMGNLSPGGFPVNPHQSFLCPSASWSSYTGSSSYTASPAYPASPCSSNQEQECRPPVTTSTAATPPTVNTTPGPLANLASLPLEIKPPPPPHLMLLGHTFGSDSTGGGATGTTPLTPSLPFADHSDSAKQSYMTGIAINASCTTAQHADMTLSAPGEGSWETAGSTTSTANNQLLVPSGAVDTTGLPKSGENLGGSNPGCQSGRTQVNCTDKSSVGVLAAATRGGSVVRPKFPAQPMRGMGYGNVVGSSPAQMNHGPMRPAMGPTAFRGRGVPPSGFWPRPGRGHERTDGTGDGPCSWGYPAGRGGPRNYYTDFTYSHNYAPE
ncbi:protein TASOR isoform X2 [Dunckerocampus dactyliophorus]|uniref:protein TASOR isoform X2 n=1 Tax=Dunckerocampus dactyliophorus TaxID=161453 RepID=UPI0024076030|nr:protein TASOR isoform X2 [Dunckerocampus dactyliophorus]